MLQHGTWIILKEKNPLPLPGFEPRTVQSEIYSLYRLRYSGFPLREGMRCLRARWELRVMFCPSGNTLFCTAYTLGVLTNAYTSLRVIITQIL
jgi:hypothetical protein